VKAVVIRKFSGTNRGRESFERFRQRATDHSSKRNCAPPSLRSIFSAGMVWQGIAVSSDLSRIPVTHPFSEEFNSRLRPRTLASRRWRRHHGPTDSPDAVVNDGGVRFYVLITCQIKRLTHRANVSVRKERANVRLKARQFGHKHLIQVYTTYTSTSPPPGSLWNFHVPPERKLEAVQKVSSINCM
jgi:hypothetical protein